MSQKERQPHIMRVSRKEINIIIMMSKGLNMSLIKSLDLPVNLLKKKKKRQKNIQSFTMSIKSVNFRLFNTVGQMIQILQQINCKGKE